MSNSRTFDVASASSFSGEPRALRVSGRAAADHLDVLPVTVTRLSEAGLLHELDGGGFDAQRVLELGQRPFVADREIQALPPYSVLFVQQSPRHWLEEGDEDLAWRSAWGWSADMSDREAVLSASGWWPVDRDRRRNLRGVVSSVGSFVVTIAVVDRENPIADTSHTKVRLNLAPATEASEWGRRMMSVFAQRRMRIRPGSSTVLPVQG